MIKQLIFLYCFCSSIAYSQVLFKNFHFTTEEGLPSNTIYSITEDRKGNIVLGTDNGLTFFDGNEFKTLNVENGLINPYIVAVTKDDKDVLWFVNYGGNLQKLVDGKITTTPIFTAYYNQILNTKKSIFLFTTQVRNPGKYYKSIELFKDKNLQINSDTLFVNPRIAAPILQQNGEVISVKNQMVHYKNFAIPLPTAVKLLHKVIFRKKDVCLLDNQKLVIVDFKGAILKSIKLPQALSEKRFFKFDFIVDQKETCWLSIQGKGLFILRDNSWENINESLDLNADQNINFLYADSKNRLWIATHENGLYCIPNSAVQTFLFSDSENNFTGFATASDNKFLYVSTNFKLYKYNNGQLSFLEKSLLPIKIDNINKEAIYYFPYFDVTKSDAELRSLKRIFGRQYIKQDGTTYYSLFNLSNIAICNTNKKELSVRNITNKIVADEKIRNVVFYKNQYYFNNNHSISIRTFDNNFIYKKKDLKIKLKGFISDFKFVNDTMWIAANNTIYKWKNNKIVDSISHINNTKLYNIRKIKIINNDVYLCAGNGLFKISAAGNRVLNKYNFLHSNDVYNVALFKDELFVGTINGLCKIENALVVGKSKSPVFDILYKNKPCSLLKIPKEVDSVELQLVIQNFYSNRNQLIQYKNDASAWVDSPTTKLNFFELGYGNHQIQIRVKDVNSDWSTITVSIYRGYPFYIKWEFYLMLFLILSFLLIAIYSYQIEKIKVKKKQEIDINNKIVELRQSALNAMMNPHFIFNSLNAIQYFINSNQRSKSSDYLGKLSRLVRLFLLHSSEPFITLESEINRLEMYVEIEQLRFNHFNFQLNVDEKLRKSTLKIPNMIVQPFIENAILHGISHLQDEDRKVELHFEIKNDILTIIISDNGYGLSRTSVKKNGHISKGIQIITERMALLQLSYPEKVFTIAQSYINPSIERKGWEVTMCISVFY